jgi:hypothetical protein
MKTVGFIRGQKTVNPSFQIFQEKTGRLLGVFDRGFHCIAQAWRGDGERGVECWLWRMRFWFARSPRDGANQRAVRDRLLRISACLDENVRVWQKPDKMIRG